MRRKERAAGYIRESDPNLLDSATIDSQAKAVRLYCEKIGYEYPPENEYKEAVSAYEVEYKDRPQLMALLHAARRGEFDVVVISEIRALGRKQVEIFIIYDLLQKNDVRLETIEEKFEDSAIGRLFLSLRSFAAESERETIYKRMERGKKDRRENGNLNGHPKPAYGYIFQDTVRETNACYALNHRVIHTSEDGMKWTEVKVVQVIFDMALAGNSMRSIAQTLTDKGIPIPKEGQTIKGRLVSGYWHPSTVNRILTNPLYTGKVVANKYTKGDGKKIVKRPDSQHIRLPDAPPIVSLDVFEWVNEQLAVNKQDALRNTKDTTQVIGILRAGYARCGICGGSMAVRRRGDVGGTTRKPEYACYKKIGNQEVRNNHATTITMDILDHAAWERAVEIIRTPELIRRSIAALREANTSLVDREAVEKLIAGITKKMHNLIKFAEAASDDSVIESLGAELKQLEKQKKDAEEMLFDVEEDEEERAKLEADICEFENWIERIRPDIDDPAFSPTYEQQRQAVRWIGIYAVVYPAHGQYPFRYQIGVAPPKIMKHLGKYFVAKNQSLALYGSLGSSFETTPAVTFQALISDCIPTPIL